jgi:hypothetical protein
MFAIMVDSSNFLFVNKKERAARKATLEKQNTEIRNLLSFCLRDSAANRLAPSAPN